jgi:hypothetical protein
MRDMREGIKKVIDVLEEEKIRKGECHLTDSQKELIEHGYIQCALQIGYDIVTKGESFITGLQDMAISTSYIKTQIKVYEINEADTVLALSEDEAKAYYEKEIAELIDEDSIIELDIDLKGMWYPTEDKEDHEKAPEGTGIGSNPTQFGDLMWYEGYLHKFMPYRKVIELNGEYKGPEIIASSEY